jgi:hypothetical protein
MGEFKQSVEKLAYRAGVIKAKPSDKKKVLDFAESIPTLYKILEKVELPLSVDYCGNKTFNICEKNRGIEIRRKDTDYFVTFKYYRLKIARSMSTIDPLSVNNFTDILDDQYQPIIDIISFSIFLYRRQGKYNRKNTRSKRSYKVRILQSYGRVS